MIDLYKKILTGPGRKSARTPSEAGHTEQQITSIRENNVKGNWKEHFQINPNLDEYGDGKADIIDFAVVDENGNLTNAIQKGTRFKLKSKVLFHEDVYDPIFTYTFKNVKGVDITENQYHVRKEGYRTCQKRGDLCDDFRTGYVSAGGGISSFHELHQL